MFNKYCILRLKEIVLNHDAEIILSSTWRLTEDKFQMVRRKLGEHGLKITDATTTDNSFSRAEQILQFLEKHKEIRHFIIIDDKPLYNQDEISASPPEYYSKIKNHIIKPNSNKGIKRKHIDKAKIRILLKRCV